MTKLEDIEKLSEIDALNYKNFHTDSKACDELTLFFGLEHNMVNIFQLIK